jgi:hypothetical protein
LGREAIYGTQYVLNLPDQAAAFSFAFLNSEKHRFADAGERRNLSIPSLGRARLPDQILSLNGGV